MFIYFEGWKLLNFDYLKPKSFTAVFLYDELLPYSINYFYYLFSLFNTNLFPG